MGWEGLGDGSLVHLVSVGFSFGIGMLPLVQSEFLSVQGLSCGKEASGKGYWCRRDCFGAGLKRRC